MQAASQQEWPDEECPDRRLGDLPADAMPLWELMIDRAKKDPKEYVHIDPLGACDLALQEHDAVKRASAMYQILQECPEKTICRMLVYENAQSLLRWAFEEWARTEDTSTLHNVFKQVLSAHPLAAFTFMESSMHLFCPPANREEYCRILHDIFSNAAVRSPSLWHLLHAHAPALRQALFCTVPDCTRDTPAWVIAETCKSEAASAPKDLPRDIASKLQYSSHSTLTGLLSFLQAYHPSSSVSLPKGLLDQCAFAVGDLWRSESLASCGHALHTAAAWAPLRAILDPWAADLGYENFNLMIKQWDEPPPHVQRSRAYGIVRAAIERNGGNAANLFFTVKRQPLEAWEAAAHFIEEQRRSGGIPSQYPTDLSTSWPGVFNGAFVDQLSIDWIVRQWRHDWVAESIIAAADPKDVLRTLRDISLESRMHMLCHLFPVVLSSLQKEPVLLPAFKELIKESLLHDEGVESRGADILLVRHLFQGGIFTPQECEEYLLRSIPPVMAYFHEPHVNFNYYIELIALLRTVHRACSRGEHRQDDTGTPSPKTLKLREDARLSIQRIAAPVVNGQEAQASENRLSEVLQRFLAPFIHPQSRLGSLRGVRQASILSRMKAVELLEAAIECVPPADRRRLEDVIVFEKRLEAFLSLVAASTVHRSLQTAARVLQAYRDNEPIRTLLFSLPSGALTYAHVDADQDRPHVIDAVSDLVQPIPGDLVVRVRKAFEAAMPSPSTATILRVARKTRKGIKAIGLKAALLAGLTVGVIGGEYTFLNAHYGQAAAGAPSKLPRDPSLKNEPVQPLASKLEKHPAHVLTLSRPLEGQDRYLITRILNSENPHTFEKEHVDYLYDQAEGLLSETRKIAGKGQELTIDIADAHVRSPLPLPLGAAVSTSDPPITAVNDAGYIASSPGRQHIVVALPARHPIARYQVTREEMCSVVGFDSCGRHHTTPKLSPDTLRALAPHLWEEIERAKKMYPERAIDHLESVVRSFLTYSSQTAYRDLLAASESRGAAAEGRHAYLELILTLTRGVCGQGNDLLAECLRQAGIPAIDAECYLAAGTEVTTNDRHRCTLVPCRDDGGQWCLRVADGTSDRKDPNDVPEDSSRSEKIPEGIGRATGIGAILLLLSILGAQRVLRRRRATHAGTLQDAWNAAFSLSQNLPAPEREADAPLEEDPAADDTPADGVDEWIGGWVSGRFPAGEDLEEFLGTYGVLAGGITDSLRLSLSRPQADRGAGVFSPLVIGLWLEAVNHQPKLLAAWADEQAEIAGRDPEHAAALYAFLTATLAATGPVTLTESARGELTRLRARLSSGEASADARLSFADLAAILPPDTRGI